MSFPVPSADQVKTMISEYDKITFYKKGGFKAVYKAYNDKLIEALKLNHIPKRDTSVSEEYIEECRKRIRREINLLSRCNSPNIVKLGQLNLIEIQIESETYATYSEEFLEGETLFELIENKYIPSESELKSLALCMIHAIQEVWKNNQSVHRDIKVLNIKKTNIDNRPFVLFDMGIAYSKSETPITLNPYQVPGTPPNIAPEMLDPNFRNSIDYRSDLYTLGITIYEYATGKHPLVRPSDDIAITFSKILRYTPVSIRTLRPELSPDFANLIDQWLKKKPHLRPSKFELILKILEDQV